MNERIRELALQAGGSHYPEVGGELLQKFSELLIKDCASKVKHVAKQGGGTYGEVILTAYNLPPRYD
jgi:hypothetical protein